MVALAPWLEGRGDPYAGRLGKPGAITVQPDDRFYALLGGIGDRSGTADAEVAGPARGPDDRGHERGRSAGCRRRRRRQDELLLPIAVGISAFALVSPAGGAEFLVAGLGGGRSGRGPGPTVPVDRVPVNAA